MSNYFLENPEYTGVRLWMPSSQHKASWEKLFAKLYTATYAYTFEPYSDFTTTIGFHHIYISSCVGKSLLLIAALVTTNILHQGKTPPLTWKWFYK